MLICNASIYYTVIPQQQNNNNLNIADKMHNESIKMEWKQEIQKIRHPSAYCQACIGQKVQQNDFMLICAICESSIHKTHYASELIGKTTNQNHLTPNIDDWKCQRCRYLIEKKFQVEIKCEFCPFPRGIMKRVIFQPVLNTKKQIWAHPQCTTWCHPIIWMKSKKRTHYFKETPTSPTSKFWFRVEDQPNKKCQLCADNYGYKIKCSFYSCQKFYHITCAKRIGVVRDLESMRFQASSDDFCPIYCQEHLEAYVLDFANRIKLYTQKKESQKIAHFTKVHNCYKIQLKNLTTSAKRSKQQQEIRNQLGKQMLIQSFEESSMSLSVSQPLSNQMNSSDSESYSSTYLAFLQNSYNIKDLDKLIEIRNKQKLERGEMYRERQGRLQKKMSKQNKVMSRNINQDIEYEQQKQMQLQGDFKQISLQQIQNNLQQNGINNAANLATIHQNQEKLSIIEEKDINNDVDNHQYFLNEEIRQQKNEMIEQQSSNSEYQKASFNFQTNPNQPLKYPKNNYEHKDMIEECYQESSRNDKKITEQVAIIDEQFFDEFNDIVFEKNQQPIKSSNIHVYQTPESNINDEQNDEEQFQAKPRKMKRPQNKDEEKKQKQKNIFKTHQQDQNQQNQSSSLIQSDQPYSPNN